ncbi:MAG: hypothetical protein Q9195_001167 [Heterodermia aff. obscurata]
MSAPQDRKTALRAFMARQTRILTSELGYKKNDRKCPICLERFWYPSDDPSLYEQPLRTSCCRMVVGADCLRMFLSPASDGGEESCECPICSETVLDLLEIGAESHDDRTSKDFKGKVRAFANSRTRQLEDLRQERSSKDCSLYQNLYEDGVTKLPGAIGSTDPQFKGSFQDRQRREGLDLHQAHALFIQLQQEGAFVPIDGKTCELADAELYNNLRKARIFFNLRYNRWENLSGQPIFVGQHGYFGTEEQLAQEAEERSRRVRQSPRSFLISQASYASNSSHASPTSRPSRES